MFIILLYFFITVKVSAQLQNDIFPIIPTVPVMTNSENNDCNHHGEIYMDNLKKLTLWAYEMKDASAKTATGVLRGSYFNMGNFRQCLNAGAPFPTQYCLVTITANVPEPKSNRHPFSDYFSPSESVINKLFDYKDFTKEPKNHVNLGWCIPASCKFFEVEKYLDEYISTWNSTLKEENVSYSVNVPEISCTSSDQQRNWNGLDTAFCVITAILIVLVVSSTWLDHNKIVTKNSKAVSYELIEAFSAKQNFNDLHKADDISDQLKTLYRLKTLLTILVIMIHRFLVTEKTAIYNFDYLESLVRKPLLTFGFNADLLVDTYFFLGGLLAMYNLLKLCKNKVTNPGLIVLLRYIRLTPTYAFMILFCSSLLNHLGDGPLWKTIVGAEVEDCKKSWWTHLLYISNYINSENMCLPHFWYLTCDFHFYVIGIGLILIFNKKEKYGLISIFVLTIVSVIIPFLIILIYERPAVLRMLPSFFRSMKSDTDFQIYIKSHARAGPYLIGMLAGYVYSQLNGKTRILSKRNTIVILLISLSIMLVSIHGGYYVFYDPFHEYNAFESAAYGALRRFIWSLGNFGLLYSISFGSFPFLCECLNWPPLIFLGKLSYSAYLCHFLFQLRSVGKVVSPVDFSISDLLYTGLSDVYFGFVFALGLYLTVEAPTRILSKKMLLSNKTKKCD